MPHIFQVAAKSDSQNDIPACHHICSTSCRSLTSGLVLDTNLRVF